MASKRNARAARRQASPTAAEPIQAPPALEPEAAPISALVQLLQQQAAQAAAQAERQAALAERQAAQHAADQAAQQQQQAALLQLLQDQRRDRERTEQTHERSEGRLLGVMERSEHRFTELISSLRGSGDEARSVPSLPVPVPSTSSCPPIQDQEVVRSVPVPLGGQTPLNLPLSQSNEVVTLTPPSIQSTPAQDANDQSRTEPSTRSSHTLKMSATFDGSTSWADYQCQFDLVAELNGWNSAAKAGNLATNLRGAASKVLSTLPKRDVTSYDKLSSALKLRFGDEHMSKLYMTQFESKRQGKNEDLATLGNEIERLARESFHVKPDSFLTLGSPILKSIFLQVLWNK